MSLWMKYIQSIPSWEVNGNRYWTCRFVGESFEADTWEEAEVIAQKFGILLSSKDYLYFIRVIPDGWDIPENVYYDQKELF